MPFRELSLADCAEHIVDNRGRTCPVGDEGMPLIATNCLRAGGLYPSYETTRFVSDEIYRTWFRGHPKPGDIIFVTKGSPGRVCLAPNPVDFCIAQDMVAIRADESKIYPRYLFAVLRSQETQQRIENMHVGTLIPHFKKGDFDRLLLPIPDPVSQREIGDLYFDLSARIDLLQRTNATLEAIAQALFKSWFVDFDPVRAKAEGRDPEGMPSEVADLFPSEFEDSEPGPIPKGWAVARLSDLVELAYGKALKAGDRRPGNVPVYGSGGITGFHDTAYVDGPSIIVGRKGTVGSLHWEDRPFYPIDTVFFVRPRNVPLTWCYYAMRRLGLENMNTDAAVPGLNRENAYRLPVVLPMAPVLAAFDELVGALRARIRTGLEQQDSLASLRDTLLPRLMSRKLGISQGGVLTQ